VPQIFRLFGYAGTGKTTLARHVAEGWTARFCMPPSRARPRR
jgi:SpoVK/Ycf46/Vps4 family AAA+-type ATPase